MKRNFFIFFSKRTLSPLLAGIPLFLFPMPTIGSEDASGSLYTFSHLGQEQYETTPSEKQPHTHEEEAPAPQFTNPSKEAKTPPHAPTTRGAVETHIPILTPATGHKKLPPHALPPSEVVQETEAGPIINFSDVQIVEFLRFASRLTGKNFIFDPDELQFTVSVISETPATVDDVMAALIQNLQIHGFELLEQGPNFTIHSNAGVKSPVPLFRGEENGLLEPQISTQVFLIEHVDPARVASIIKHMLSKEAVCELIPESKRLVITDVSKNIQTVARLLSSLDSPNSGLDIGQFVGQNSTPPALAALTTQLLGPLTSGQIFVLIPHIPSNSVFVVSSPFLVERALSVMQKIDLGENTSGIFSFDNLKFDPELAGRLQEEALLQERMKTGNHFTDEEIDRLSDDEINAILREKGYSDEEIARMSKEQIRKILRETELSSLGAAIREELRKKKIFESTLPLGQVESTHFYIHKLQYRRSEEVVRAVRAIAASLQRNHAKNARPSDLVVTLNTLQTMDEDNSIVLTGTNATLEKAKKLIAEIDIPVRQIFIEILVLNTTISNSLNFGVEWGAKLQRRNLAVEGGLFESPTNNIPNALAGVTQVPPPPLTPPPHGGSFPAPVFDLTPNTVIGAAPAQGFTTGSIGRKILFNGHGFVAVAGLVHALRADTDSDIIMNPKITTEHNVPAEIFVGAQIGIKAQTVSNNNQQILTTNYQTVNTGILFKVTPLISAGDMVTLIIEQRISNANQAQVQNQGNQNAPPATVNEARTLTRVHLPTDYFLVLSGMIQETRDIKKDQIPCLGGLPLIGNLFGTITNSNAKQNLMMFIRPHIIENDIDIDDITKKQQDIFQDKSGLIRNQRTIADDLKDMLNL